jgi:hypothetical protein
MRHRRHRDRFCQPLLVAVLGVVVLGFLAPRGAALASVCHAEAVPAATLLLPYFEVDLSDPNGLTTLFSINNAVAAAVLGHVTIWSDLAVPVATFDVYLTGYDVQTVNLRDVLIYGRLPQTASAGQDPNDTISPKGLYSQDIDFPSCQGVLPPPPLPASFLSHLQNALTGRPSALLQGRCAAQFLGDNVARGYITVDTVRNCTSRTPADFGYFLSEVAAPDATDQNVLWGNWIIVNSAQGYAEGSTLVAIEADGGDPATSTPGSYTFYGRYVGWSAADHRGPLATTFAAQYATGGPFDAGTSYLVWRDPKVAQAPFDCPIVFGNRPIWYPMDQEGLVIFDEQETAAATEVFCLLALSPHPSASPAQCPPQLKPTPFPAATQRVAVGGAQLPVPFIFGWLFLDLNTTVAVDPNVPPADRHAAQAWVVATQASHAHFAVALDAYRLDSACSANHAFPGSP